MCCAIALPLISWRTAKTFASSKPCLVTNGSTPRRGTPRLLPPGWPRLSRRWIPWRRHRRGSEGVRKRRNNVARPALWNWPAFFNNTARPTGRVIGCRSAPAALGPIQYPYPATPLILRFSSTPVLNPFPGRHFLLPRCTRRKRVENLCVYTHPNRIFSNSLSHLAQIGRPLPCLPNLC